MFSQTAFIPSGKKIAVCSNRHEYDSWDSEETTVTYGKKTVFAIITIAQR
jgi:hypothetical protein